MNVPMPDHDGCYNPDELGVGTYWQFTGINIPIVVVGEAQDSPYEEDMPYINEGRRDGYIFGKWSSEACPDGELGSNHVTRCVPISKEQYSRLITDIKSCS